MDEMKNLEYWVMLNMLKCICEHGKLKIVSITEEGQYPVLAVVRTIGGQTILLQATRPDEGIKAPDTVNQLMKEWEK